MAKPYRAPQTINRIVMWLARRGIGRAVVLTTVGRRSGRQRHVPLSPIFVDDVEYLVAPYGVVGWVANARANPEATITAGRSVREVVLREVTRSAAHVVRRYYEREWIPRAYMDLPGDPTLADFELAAGSFPVFRVGER